MRAMPHLCGFYPGICLTTEEKARKNLSQVSRRAPAGTNRRVPAYDRSLYDVRMIILFTEDTEGM